MRLWTDFYQIINLSVDLIAASNGTFERHVINETFMLWSLIVAN